MYDYSNNIGLLNREHNYESWLNVIREDRDENKLKQSKEKSDKWCNKKQKEIVGSILYSLAWLTPLNY